jgi:hypothetical protein
MPGGSVAQFKFRSRDHEPDLSQKIVTFTHFAAETLELSIAINCLAPGADLPVDWDLKI